MTYCAYSISACYCKSLIIPFRKQLKSYLEKLQHLKSVLDNHKTPRLSPERVKRQLQHLEVNFIIPQKIYLPIV